MAYVELEDFLLRYPEVTNENDQEILEALLSAVSAYVDKATSRPDGYFSPSPDDPTDKFLQGQGQRFLMLPAHVKGSVAVTAMHEDAYYEHPDNGWLYLQPSNAAAGIAINANSSYECGHAVWRENQFYQVSARWGYAETPPDIIEAIIQITSRWWETQKGTLGQVTPTGFVVERSVPPSAAAILVNYTPKPYQP